MDILSNNNKRDRQTSVEVGHNSRMKDQKILFQGQEDKKDENNPQIDQLQQLFRKIKVKNCIRKFVEKTNSRMYKFLNTYHLQLINDNLNQKQRNPEIQAHVQKQTLNKRRSIFLSSNYQSNIAWRVIFYKMIKTILNKVPIFHPSSYYKFVWDFIMICAISFLLFVIPIRISFNIQYNQFTNEQSVDLASYMIFLDIGISINTGYYDKGMQIKDRWKIIKYYFKTNILTEILGCFSLIANFIQFYEGYVIRDIILLLFLFKINHFSNIAKRIQERFLLNRQTKNILQFIKLLFTIIFISHIYACAWIYVAYWEKSMQINSWVDSKNLTDSEWQIQYCQSFYFIIVTMCTVGYGDTAPINSREQILCIITILTACGLFGYSMNTIGIIIQEITKTENEINSNLHIISSYMHSKQINKELQYQVRKYLEYYFREISTRNLDAEEKIIGQLSEMLKKTLQIEANKIIIKDSPIFAPNFSDEILIKTIPLIQECRFTPEEIIYSDKQIDDNSIYFIEKGQVEIFQIVNQKKPQEKYHSLKILDQGKSFGTINFFTGQPRQFSVKSLQFSTLLKIKRDDFINLVKGYPEEYETFCHIRDNMLLNNNYYRIGEKCYSCGSIIHSIENCPYIHFVPDRLRLTKVNNKSINQERQNKERKYYSKQHKYIMMDLLLEKVIQFSENNEICLDLYEEQYLFLQDNDPEEDLENLNSENQLDQKEQQEESQQVGSYNNDSGQSSSQSDLEQQQQSQQNQTQTIQQHQSQKPRSLLQIIQQNISDDNNKVDYIQEEQKKEQVCNHSICINNNTQSSNINNDQASCNNLPHQDIYQNQKPGLIKNIFSGSLSSSSSLMQDEQQIKINQSPSSIMKLISRKTDNNLEQNSNGKQKKESMKQQKSLSQQKSKPISKQSKNMINPQSKNYSSFIKRLRSQVSSSPLQKNKKDIEKINSTSSIDNYMVDLKYLIKQQKLQLDSAKQQELETKHNTKDFDRFYNFAKYMPWNNLVHVLELINIQDSTQYKIYLDKIKQLDHEIFSSKLSQISKKGNLPLIKKMQQYGQSPMVRKGINRKTRLKTRSQQQNIVIKVQNKSQIKEIKPILKKIESDNVINQQINVQNSMELLNVVTQQQNKQTIQYNDFSFDNLPKEENFNEVIPVSHIKLHRQDKSLQKQQFSQSLELIQDDIVQKDINETQKSNVLAQNYLKQ